MNEINARVFTALAALASHLYGLGTVIRMSFDADSSTFVIAVFRNDNPGDVDGAFWQCSGRPSSSFLGACRHLVMSTMEDTKDYGTLGDHQTFNLYHSLFNLLGSGPVILKDIIAAGPSQEEMKHLQADKKILVVKSVRTRCNLDLSDAKHIMDAWVESGVANSVEFHRSGQRAQAS